MNILLLGNQAESLCRFRKDLIATFLKDGHKVILVTPEPKLETLELIRKMGVSFVPIPLDRTSLNPFKDIFIFIYLFRMLKILKPDIMFCYTIKLVLYGPLAACLCRIRNCYSVVTGAGYIFTGQSLKHLLLRPIIKLLYSLSLGLNNSVFFLNPDDLKMFTENGWLRDKRKAILIAGEGVNLVEFPWKPIPDGPPRFLFIGRLLRDKGVEEFAHAAGVLKVRYPEVHFEILGPMDSNPTAIKTKILDDWLQRGMVEYLGETPDVQTYLAKCTVFVLPSYREGLPRTTMEALSTGRPIVTTDVPGCRETVNDGENGYLVPAKNVESLAQAMEKFLIDPTLAPRMGRASRKLAEYKFDVNKINKIILDQTGL